jgi:hypothetical protein
VRLATAETALEDLDHAAARRKDDDGARIGHAEFGRYGLHLAGQKPLRADRR